MAKNIQNVNLNVDTFESWIYRTNEILEALRSEVLTANSLGGVTGTPQTPLRSILHGSFTANALAAFSSFSANSTQIRIAGVPLNVNGSFGTPGQVLSSNGTAIFWSTPPGGGGPITINTGVGLSGGPISSNGSIQVRANTGVIANTSGLFVDEAYVRQVVGTGVSVSQLLGQTWASPGAIGSQVANSGVFTSVTSISNYRLGTTGSIVINSAGIYSPGILEATTPPNAGSTGALRIRARGDNTRAFIQVVNNDSTEEWSHVNITPDSWNFTSDLTFRNGIQVGYRNIPQVILNTNTSLQTSNWNGQHLYKTSTSEVTFTVPDNGSDNCPIGTAITIINDSPSGNIILAQSGSTILQLGGTFSSGNRIVSPGGVATIIKVQTNKWIVSGTGVL